MIKLVLRMGYHLRDTRKAELPAQTLDALAYLEPWYENGARLDWTSPGMELAAEFRLNFREANHPVAWIYGGGHPGTGLFVKTITARLDENPQAVLQPEEQEFVAGCSPTPGSRRDKYGDQPDQWREKALRNRVGATLGYMVNNRFPSLAPQWDVVAPLLPVVASAQPGPTQPVLHPGRRFERPGRIAVAVAVRQFRASRQPVPFRLVGRVGSRRFAPRAAVSRSGGEVEYLP
jgi:hypothetical protein